VLLFTSDDLGLVALVFVLVLRLWSCLHHWFIRGAWRNTFMDWKFLN